MEASEASAAPSRLGMRGTVLVGATLFSMFFGAGNLILPPLLGVQAASSTVPAMIGFFVTGVGLPVLGIVAVALAGTVRELADRVHPVFSRVFVAAVYLAIGPCLAIPRTSSTAFEMLVPLLPEGSRSRWSGSRSRSRSSPSHTRSPCVPAASPAFWGASRAPRS